MPAKPSELDAESLLAADMKEAVSCVNLTVRVGLKQCEFDGLADFTFNVGPENFVNSTLLRKLNAGDFAGAAEQFLLWIHAGNRVVQGLVTRRKAEHDLFLAD